MKMSVLSYSLEELSQVLQEENLAPYRAKQLFYGIYKLAYTRFSQFSFLPKTSRESLAKRFSILPLVHVDCAVSRAKDAYKYLLKLQDGSFLESVLLVDSGRHTLCVSSQVGCALGCAFCATGKMGLVRNLNSAEILAQFLYLRARHQYIDNLVFMGMGEAFMNYRQVKKALAILRDPLALNFSLRRVTLSTAGLSHAIKRLADDALPVRLAVSLHSTVQEKRLQLMPFAKNISVDALLKSCQYYQKLRGKRITFEYVLLAGVNMGDDEVKTLAQWRKFLKFNVNLIPYNPVDSCFQKPSAQEITRFLSALKKAGVDAVLRKTRGTDIMAACGQLLPEYKQLEKQNLAAKIAETLSLQENL